MIRRRQTTILALCGGVWALGMLLFTGCTELLGSFEVGPGVDVNFEGGAGTTSSSSGTSGTSSSGASSGTSGNPTCKGDTIDACGATCTKCTAPSGGTVECVAGACQQKCPGTQIACANTCTDGNRSKEHCGRCDRNCGAGDCTAGACLPFPVITGLVNVHTISTTLPEGVVISANQDLTYCDLPNGCTSTNIKTIKAGVSQLNDAVVVGPNVYYDGNEGDFEIIYRCPVLGCPGTGPETIDRQVNDGIGRVIAGPNTVLWTRLQSFYGPYSKRCTLPQCADKLDVRPQPTTGPYSQVVDREQTIPTRITSVGAASTLWATGSLFNNNVKQLRACPLTGACPTPLELDTGANSVSALTFHNGKHYGASFASGGGNVIFSVEDATPTVARTLLVTDAAGIVDVAVDPSGIYWVNGMTGRVAKCPTLTGCMGTGETLATGQQGALKIRLDSKFVYWLMPNAVMKVAK
jgi:hypothetical protein